jgi:hypothetical protein
MKIYLKVTTQYGRERIFPACPVSTKLAELIRQKTFDRSHLRILKELGYEFEVKQDVPKL